MTKTSFFSSERVLWESILIGRWVLFSFLILKIVVSEAWAGSIGGLVFEDQNRNGVFDASEPALPDISIRLLGADGAVLQQTRTLQDGSYLFMDLPDGDYVLSVPESTGLRFSLPDVAGDPAPIPNFPFGRPRYGAMPNLVPNLNGSMGGFRHVGLGDSIGFGFNFCGSLLGEDGYIEPTTDRLARATAADVITDKQAIPGHETADLLKPGRGPGNPLEFNDIFYAIDNSAPLISISIGGNDFLNAEDGGDSAIGDALVTARRNIQEIISNLVSELPLADIEFNTVYDNLEGQDALHNIWVPIWNQVLRESAWGQHRRVTLAEIYPEYAHEEDGQILGEPGLICHDFLGLDGIHPTNAGYDVHEEKLWQAFGGVTLSGGDRLDFNLGFLRVRGRATPSAFADVTGGTTNPEQAFQPDGVGALIPSNNAEFRLSGFLPGEPPTNLDLAQAVLKVRYRTTAAPLDDYYRFEVSIDGSFSPPGSTSTTWNTIIPVVGSSGNDGAPVLAFADQPNFRIVSSPLYSGAPTSGAGTLSWDDLKTLTVRVVTTAVGEPDAYALEWDSAVLEVYTRPAGVATVVRADDLGYALSLARRDPDRVRRLVRDAVDAGEEPALAFIEALGAVSDSGDIPLLRRLLSSPSSLVRGHAVRALVQAGGLAVLSDLVAAASDSHPGVRRSAIRGLLALGDKAPVGILAQMAQDADPVVRLVAVRALGELPGTEAVLIGVVASDLNFSVRVEAAAKLLERGNASAIGVLIEALSRMPHARRARDALVKHGMGRPELLEALQNPESNIRSWSAWILGQHGRSADPVVEALRPLLSDGNPAVVVAAMDALSRLDDRESITEIAAMRGTPSLIVDVAQALGRFDDPPARAALFHIATSLEAPLTARRIAARGLALSSGDVVRMLEELKQSEDLRIRRIAAAGRKR